MGVYLRASAFWALVLAYRCSGFTQVRRGTQPLNSYTDPSVTDRRSQARLTATELAMISYKENGTKVRQLANIEDISLNGAGILVDRAVAVGTALTMTYGQGELAAVVRHCAQTGAPPTSRKSRAGRNFLIEVSPEED